MSEEFHEPTIALETTGVVDTQATQEPTGTAVDTTTTEEVAPQEQAQPPVEYPKIQYKFNHDSKEMSYEEAPEYIQKGLNYDKVNEKYTALQNDPRLSFVERYAKANNMSVDEWMTAVNQMEEQEKLDSLIEQNIPPQYAQEMIDNKNFRDKYEAEQKDNVTKQAKETEYIEFMAKFPGVQGTDLTPETWALVNSGTPLKYAYMEQLHNENTKAKAVQQNNNKVAQATTGSATGQGGQTAGDDVITQDTFEANRSNQSWVNKNYKKIQASMAKWSSG